MRQIVVDALSSSQKIWDLLGGDELSPENLRIYEASSLSGTPQRPFVTYRMNTGFSLLGGVGRRDYAQIWINDDPGTYQTIDEIVAAIDEALTNHPASGLFLDARWIETSTDLKDDVMGTINRYMRFQLTGTRREGE